MPTQNKEAALARVSVTVTCPECYKRVRTESSSYVTPPECYKGEDGKGVICHGCGNMIQVQVSAWSKSD